MNETENPPATLRGFWALIVTQFQGAFSDNTLKWLTTYLITQVVTVAEERDHLISVVTVLFTLPFILFSMTGGFLADRFSKRNVILGVKTFEIFVMSLALFSLASHRLYLTIFCVFLMSLHSAIFGPSKYGILPELLPEKKLSWGNGILEFGTFIAIIGGTVAGGVLCTVFAAAPGWSGVILVVLAVIGMATGWQITRVPAANPSKRFRLNIFADVWGQMKIMHRDRPLWLALIGYTYFFAIAALIQLVIVIYARDVMNLNNPVETSYLQAATAVGIGTGCFLAGFLSEGKIETGLIPLGAVGLTICAALLGRHGISFRVVAANLSVLGFFGGFYIVPISAMLQHRPARDQKGAVQGVANLVSWLGIGLSAAVFSLLTTVLKLSPPEIFVVIAGLTFVATVYLLWLMPEALLRFALWCLTNSLYRIKVIGRDNIPVKGGALFVCNHLSFADGLLLLASTDRPIRFLMFKDIYEKRWIKPLARIMGAIPISSEQRPRELLHSLQVASDAIRAGEVVCIFAEGQITRVGQLLEFRRGFERIMKDVDAPIIPVALDGVLGSPTSFEHNRMVRRFPRRIPHPVTVSFGAPLPPTTPAIQVREAVQDLIADGWFLRRGRMEPLPRDFIRMARKHPRRFCLADATSCRLNFRTALVKTVFLARRLKKVWAGQSMVGIYLPPSVPGALVNHAAHLCGKIPVNLNYTLSETALAACANQCGLKTIITSRKFLEKIKLTPPGQLLFLEDLAAKPGGLEKIAALLLATLAPFSLLKKAVGRDHSVGLDDLATIIFSSGSTGEPKGVKLSHYNIVSNIRQMEHILDLAPQDCFLGILPFFHSFGFTVTLCLPAAAGCGVVFHPNPLDTKPIGSLVREQKVTLLLATPTFLQLYLRSIPPEDFGGLHYVITGAERLPERIASAFEEHFGIRPLEGYGTTECGPAVSVNMMNFRAPGFHQVAGKRGKIGRPLLGMKARIVDPENPWGGRTLPAGESGMLLLKGPNIMGGYLGQPEKTAEVLHDGWYCTGDIASLDEDGFLQITGRLSRYSKIGGEMVPHLKIEEKLHELAGTSEQTFVVAGVPDEKKGERLVVLHKLKDAELPSCLEKFNGCDLPNLWKPKADAFHYVDQFPMLGTGKLDLRGIKEVATRFAQEGIS